MSKNKSKKVNWLQLKEYSGSKQKDQDVYPWLLMFPTWLR